METHWKFQLNTNGNFYEMSMEIQLKFNRFEWKSIVNLVKIPMKYQLKSIGNPVERK